MHRYVSLGYNCATATALNNHQLRFESLPFDWMLADLSYASFLIQTQFAQLLENCVKVPGITGCTDIRAQKRHGTTFPHQDFTDEAQSQAMIRRCARFLKLINDRQMSISFIYYSDSAGESLASLLAGLHDFHGIYPLLQCTHRLIVVRTEDALELHERNIESLQGLALYMPSAPSNYVDNKWRGNSMTWQYLFSLF